MARRPCVYMMASRPGGATYVGVTSDLHRRVLQHRTGKGSSFAARYQVHRLVWYEWHDRMDEAIFREKQIKSWQRAWKSALIAEHNPPWNDLFDELA